MTSLKPRIKEQARALGFELCGIAPAAPTDGFDHLRDWLEQGYAGEMAYMERHADARRHPASILDAVRSVVMVGMNYFVDRSSLVVDRSSLVVDRENPSKQLTTNDQRSTMNDQRSTTGKVARYAQGNEDYHEVLWRKLDELLDWIQREMPACRGRAVVDTAPLLERDFARRAGLGWFGKNTMLLNKRLGSWFFLGALLLDLELAPDAPFEARHCGTCTACLDACPTDAFPRPGILDARRCISYLTIELRGPVPEELREEMGDWVFGCDICQDVCPWNRKAPSTSEPALQPRADLVPMDLIELLGLTEEEFRQRFRGTALTRAKRRGLLRNAALALGNQGKPSALPALQRAMNDPDPLIREATGWAIARIHARMDTIKMNMMAAVPDTESHHK